MVKIKLKKIFSTINHYGQKYWYIWLVWDIIKIGFFLVGGWYLLDKYGWPFAQSIIGGI